MDTLDKINFLQHIELFKGLDQVQLESIAIHFESKTYTPHEILITQDDMDDSMFFIVIGVVRVYRLTEDGKEVQLSFRKSGDSIGEMAFIDHSPRSAFVEAVNDTSVLVISSEKFKTIANSNPSIYVSLLQTLVARLRENNYILEGIVSKSLKEKTFELLTTLDNYFPNHEIPLSQEELAEIIGATRARVSESLGELENEGKITISHRKITLG
jgi:CRP-like cAMP-binding protein